MGGELHWARFAKMVLRICFGIARGAASRKTMCVSRCAAIVRVDVGQFGAISSCTDRC